MRDEEGKRQALELHSCAGCQPGRSGASDGVLVCGGGVVSHLLNMFLGE